MKRLLSLVLSLVFACSVLAAPPDQITDLAGNPLANAPFTSGQTYIVVLAPTVSAVSPAVGPMTGGTSVTLTGTDLTGATAVKFGSTNATSFAVISATSITATAPGSAGTVNITVTTVGGTSATAAGNQFTYYAQPTVTAVSPSAGPTAGGSSVTLTGTSFTGATAVKFGSTNATSFTVNSATSITATSPAGSLGGINITVTTPGGTSSTGAGNQFTYAVPGTLEIVSSVDPAVYVSSLTGDALSSANPAVSFDGRYIAFISNASNMVAGQAGTSSGNLYLRDRTSNTTTLVSRVFGSPATAAGGCSAPSISADGRYVAFVSTATNLVSPATSGTQVFLYDRQTATLTLVSHAVSSAATAGTGTSSTPLVSRDGSSVVFVSNALDLVSAFTGGNASVYRYDRATGAITLASHRSGEATAGLNAAVTLRGISYDGRWIAYSSVATDAVSGYASGGGATNLYLFDVQADTTRLLNRGAGTPATSANGNVSGTVGVSSDGRYVAFLSAGSNLVSGQTGSGTQLYLYNRITDTTTLVSRSTSAATAGANATIAFGTSVLGLPVISDDGRFIAFTSTATDLVSGYVAGGGGSQAYVYDRLGNSGAGSIALVTHSTAGAATGSANVGGGVITTIMSPNGSRVIFSSSSTDMVSGISYGGLVNVFAYTTTTGALNVLSTTALNGAATSAAGAALTPVVSGNGAFVAFNSTANDLASGDGNGSSDIFGAALPFVAIAPEIFGELTATATYGTAVSFTVPATNIPTAYTATGLPAGLSVDPATGVISGAPTQTGTFNVTLGASNTAGSGSATLTITVGAKPITVTANSAQTKVYGDIEPTLSYSVSPALVGGDTLSGALTRGAGESVGSYAIGQGTLAGGANYTLTFVPANFAITARPITVTANSAQTKIYGDSDPTFTYTLTSGSLIGSDTLGGALTRAAGEGVGGYAISQGTLAGGANYALTFVSANFAITPRPITVTANSGQTKIYGDVDPTFTYAITSGSLVSGDSFSGALSRATGSVVGPYAIAQGTLTAGANYALTFASANFTITAKPITVTATGGQSKVYASADPTFIYTVSPALIGSDTFSGALSREAGETAGAYALTQGTLTAGANYAITFAAANFTISKATLTVTADDKSRGYGAANPVFTAAVSGFLNGDTLATATTGAPVLTTTADASSARGTYPIAVATGTLAAANYNFTLVDGTLTVTKAVLTVTADNKSRVYGEANPTLTYTVTGYLNGDTASVITGVPVLATSAVPTSAAATYPITIDVTALSATNYNLTAADGTLTVTKAVLTVTADNKSRIFGDTEPLFTAVISGFLNGDTTATAVTGTPAITTSAVSTSDVGSYPITPAAGSLAASNYSFAFVDGSLAITPKPITVTATGGQSKTYASADPTFAYTVNPALLGSDTFSGALSRVAGETAGAYALTQGTLTAGANYAITFAAANFTISKATLTMTADDKSRGYGAANPVFTAAVSGFLNGDTLATATTGAPVLTTTANASSAQGTYPIAVATGTLAAANYNFTLVDGTLTVTKAVLTVTADNKARVYGEANPTLTYTVTGYLNGDTASVITGVPVLATSAVSTSAAATYPITIDVTALSATNYNFTAADGMLTVTKAVLTVTADNKSRIFGDTEPVFTAVISGFVNGDTAATVITGAPALSTSATLTSSVGSYPIVPALGTLVASNYSFTFVNGTLSIAPATTLVQLSGLTQAYNGQPRSVATTTTPGGIAVQVTYNGGNTPPVDAGSYAVVATITDGNHTGSASGTLQIEKAAQTLTFSLSGADLSVGAPISLHATASSGLPVTFSVVSGSASLNGSTLVVNDAGAVTVRATQAGNTNYLPVSAEQVVTGVAKLAQTITFPVLNTRLTSDEAFGLTATASSGLPVTFTIISGPAMLNGSLVILTGAPGTVTVRASQAGNATYAAAADVVRQFNVVDEGNDVFFGDVDNTSNEKVGTVAASIPASSNTGTLMVVAPSLGVNAVLNFTLNPDGSFIATIVVTTNDAGAVPAEDGPARARATQTLTVRGRLVAGVLSGRIDELNLSFSTPVQPRTGSTAAIAGFYQSNALNTNTGSTASIVGTQGQVLVVATTPTLATGAAGTIGANGTFNVQAPGATIAGAVDAPSTTVSGTIVTPGQAPIPFSGLAATTTRTDRLINLSSRVRVGPAAGRTLITGFVIGGNSTKRVLLRAIGPALSNFGVGGALSNPRLELYDATGTRVLSNDDWSGADTAAAFGQVGAFSLTTGSRDAALLTTLAPGAYTMHVMDGGETGVALAEIYDASVNPQSEYQRLINISSRGTVEAGEGVLIGGFVVTGNAPKRVLVRGIGPGLTPFGVSGALVDPRIRIYRGTELIGENDNWSANAAETATLSTAMRDTGAFALTAGSRDAAIVLTLAPGAYTAQVSATDNTTGVALVEIYEIPE